MCKIYVCLFTFLIFKDGFSFFFVQILRQCKPMPSIHKMYLKSRNNFNVAQKCHMLNKCAAVALK